MKRTTLEKNTKLSNDILYYIYTHIDTDINLDDLANDLGISRFYMHKVFKEIFGRNIYESIKSIRLQKAASLLLTNRYSTITEIAASCGYASQSSFIRVFKERFAMTPKQWRQGGYKTYSNQILAQSPLSHTSTAHFEDIQPQIVKMPEIKAYYIRHRGYNAQIKQTWQKLQTWCFGNDLQNYKEIALLHDNPTVTPLEECHYVACITDDAGKIKGETKLPKFRISGGVYAKFEISGKRGDFLKFIQWVYHEWLPASGYETTTKPPYAIHHKNHYLSSDERFEISFYLSIRY